MVIIMDGVNIEKPTCVLNILNTENGLIIAEEMKEWLLPLYNVIEIYHNGDKYEYYGLKAAKEYSINNKCSVLYLHTKGAVNSGPTQDIIRKFWKYEFTNVNKYFLPLKTDIPTLIAPFIGEKKQTWFNGFVANHEAWNIVDIKESNNRYYYEDIFEGYNEINSIGTIMNNVIGGEHELSKEQTKMFKHINDIINFNKQLAITCHIHDENIFYNEITPRLLNLPYKFDLYITLTENEERKGDIKRITELFPNSTISVIPNLGEDVRGFLTSLNDITHNNKEYDYICKIHTKSEKEWLTELLKDLLSFDFNNFNKSYTFIASKKHFKTYKKMLTTNSKYLSEQLEIINCKTKTSNHFSGTMFWISFDICRKYLIDKLLCEYFDEPYNHQPITKQHSTELLFGCIAYEEGFVNVLLCDENESKINKVVINNSQDKTIANNVFFNKKQNIRVPTSRNIRMHKRGVYW